MGALGALSDRRDHLESDNGCDYVQLWCTNEHCQEIVIRAKLLLTTETQNAIFVNILAITVDLSNHTLIFWALLHECIHFPMNKCGKKSINREDLSIHVTFFPLQPIDCPFKDAGCTRKIFRKDMEGHIENGTQEHLLMVFKSFQEQVAKSNKQLKARIEKKK